MSLLSAYQRSNKRAQFLARQFPKKSGGRRRPGGEELKEPSGVVVGRALVSYHRAESSNVSDENDGNRINARSSYSSYASNSRIYINMDVQQAMQAEVDNLPLPATLASVCIALSTSADVIEAYADAHYTMRKDDDSIKSLEIMGSYLQDHLSISSPTQQREKRKSQFQSACRSLIAGGNNTMLKTWEDVERSLSQLFIFAVIDVEKFSPNDDVPSPPPPQQQSDAPSKSASLTPSPKRGMGKPKDVPKSANRHPRKKNRLSMSFKAVVASTPSFLPIESYKDQIKRRIGSEKYHQLYHQGESLETQPSLSVYESEKAKFDKLIKQKESERRSSIREAEVLAAKEKAIKEKEAKESAKKLMRQLTPDEQRIVTKAIRGIGPPSEILASQDADSVQRSSMQTLNPGQWLNDEVINYFLKNCLAKRDEKLCAQQPGRKRSHFFNSFFVQTMFDDKNNNLKLRGKYNYKNVKRWSKKVPGKDIFQLRYILCPINLDNTHWTSAVIFMEEKRIQYYDSLGGTDRAKLEGLLQYVKDEYKVKNNGQEMDATEWELVGCTRDTPRQRNGECE